VQVAAWVLVEIEADSDDAAVGAAQAHAHEILSWVAPVAAAEPGVLSDSRRYLPASRAYRLEADGRLVSVPLEEPIVWFEAEFDRPPAPLCGK
jgi:hypothetical protein